MQVGELFVVMGLDTTQFERGLNEVKTRTLTVGNILKNALSFGIGMGLVQGFTNVKDALVDFIQTASRTETLNVAMLAVARATGTATDELLEQKKRIMELGIAEQEATQILTRFMQSQLDIAQAAKIARIAQDAAVIAGMNSSQAAEQMVEAVAKLRPELLEAFGMTKNLNDIYRDYAATIGKTVTDLTEVEKKQAMLNYLFSEGKKIAGTYEAAMGTAGKKLGSLKRYWDTVKNALAGPLALPSFGVLVDNITNALKSIIKWADANKNTLRMWGQTIANTMSFVVNVIGKAILIIISIWDKFGTVIIAVAGSVVTYITITRVATAVTNAWSLVFGILTGRMAATRGVLRVLSVAVSAYQIYMAGATVSTNIFASALTRVRALLYAVNAALGPVGWVIIGLSVVLGIGINLWNKYNESLRKNSIAPTMKTGTTSVQQTNKELGKQEDALKKVKKAAQDNIQSFDEVHKIQEETANSLEDMNMPEMSAPEIGTPEIGGMDFSNILGNIDEQLPPLKEKIKGFISWIGENIKSGLSSAFEWIKGKWDDVWTTVIEFWKSQWNGFRDFLTNTWQRIYATAPQFWDALGNYITTLWTGIVNIGTAIWNGLVTILQVTWQTIYTIAINVWGLIRDFLTANWQGVRAHAVAIWEAIKNYFIAVWNVLVGIASTTWNSIASIIQSYITLMKVTIETIWAAVKGFLSDTWTAIKNTAIPLWAAIKEAVIKPIQDAYNSLVTVWNTIKTFVLNKWNEIRSGILSTGSNLWSAITKPFFDAKTTISNIIDDAFNWGRNLISNIINGITSMVSRLWDTVSNVANTIKGFLGFHSPTELGPGRDADKWAPNFMKMYAQGITGNINIIESAVNTVAGKLSGITAVPSFAVAGGTVGSSYTPTGIPQPEIHLHIGTLIADDYGLKKLEQRLREIRIFEEQRLGSDNR